MKESVIYQELWEEARLESERSLVVRLLTRQMGELSEDLHSQINALSIDQVESLAEALLDFTQLSDLENWLASQNT